jgi:hypothetical protein
MKVFGKEKWDESTIFQFLDAVESDRFYTGELQPSLKQETIDKMTLLASYHSQLKFDNNQFTKLKTSQISNKMVQEMLNKLKVLAIDENAISLKYLAFSGHNTNLIPFLHVLGLTNTKCLRAKINSFMKGKVYEPKNGDDEWCEPIPGFAAGLVFELAEGLSSEGFFVTTYYNGRVFDICDGKGGTAYPGSCEWAIWVDIFIEKTMEANFNFKCFGHAGISNAQALAERESLENSNASPGGLSAWFFLALGLFLIVILQAAILVGALKKNSFKKMPTFSEIKNMGIEQKKKNLAQNLMSKEVEDSMN